MEFRYKVGFWLGDCMTNYRTAIEASLQSMRKRKFDIVCLASWLTDFFLQSSSGLICSVLYLWATKSSMIMKILCTVEVLNTILFKFPNSYTVFIFNLFCSILFSSHLQVWSALLCTFEPLNHPWWWRYYARWDFWTQLLSNFRILMLHFSSTSRSGRDLKGSGNVLGIWIY